ncbi:LPS export ABC transporter periplasmic protein LptC [Falsiroseomonas sp. CW058]|uniref:LPS export ABC transporter periplasmic protein LptC n=1 Tax=Falsiroseomonas sp. CW058 TaxID=3388664 RepID=UPI003D32307F
MRVPPTIASRSGGPAPLPGRAAPRRMLAPSRERRAPTPGELARRRLLVSVAKRVLPMAAVGLLALVALWPELDSAADKARVSFRRVVQIRPEALRIVEPRYQGLDEQNRPYTVTAEVAVQMGDEEVVQLQAPRADMVLGDGAWVYIEAREGRFDKPRNLLDLAGRVTVHHDDGTEFATEAASMDLALGSASGDLPVAAQGPFGTLTAQGFRLRDRGQVVVFTGQSRVVLESAAGGAAP